MLAMLSTMLVHRSFAMVLGPQSSKKSMQVGWILWTVAVFNCAGKIRTFEAYQNAQYIHINHVYSSYKLYMNF